LMNCPLRSGFSGLPNWGLGLEAGLAGSGLMKLSAHETVNTNSLS
jgi:hypothetical protein